MDIKKILNGITVNPTLCEYWDVRVEDTHKTSIGYEDFEPVRCATTPSLGAFIRVYQNGMWFYTATTELERLSEQILELCEQALNFKGEQAAPNISPYNRNSFQDDLIRFGKVQLDRVSLDEKKDICKSYFDDVQSFEKLKDVRIMYVDEYKVKYFHSSTDITYSYDFNQCGLFVGYTVTDGKGEFNDGVKFYGSKIDDLKGQNQKLKEEIEESHLFVNAKTIESGQYPVVMDHEIVGVFAHESFGHKSEADFMIGDESAKEAWKIGKRVGSNCLSIVDHGSEQGTSGYCPYDDEGFPTQKTYLIKEGILTGRLHSQQTAHLLDEAPTGNGRAISFEFEPIVRMTNTYVEPGDKTFDELISDVKLGIFAKDYKYGTGMSTFTIAPRKCYIIRDGKIAEPIRASVISGSVFEALGEIRGCSRDFELNNSAMGGCGKGEQSPLPVGHGGPQVLINKLVVS